MPTRITILVMAEASLRVAGTTPSTARSKARQVAARTGGAAEGEPRPKAGAGSPQGNTGRRAAGCAQPRTRHQGLKKEMGVVRREGAAQAKQGR